jgi:hypothetical protein
MSGWQFPAPPPLPADQIGEGSSSLRYEDVAQDGRLRLEGVWPPIGPILWGRLAVAQSLGQLGRSGVRTVLSYVAMEGGDDPISVRNRAQHKVYYQLGHTLDDSGAVNRILFNSWIVSEAPRGLPNNPGVPHAGEPVFVARAFGQHVFSRPAAPAGKHRVLSLEGSDLPAVPGSRLPWHDARGLLSLPEGVEAIEPTPRADTQATAFGLVHTDGNQHVNFLSYPRLAEEAALRRLSELGVSTRLLARRVEVGYRKPCFAGDRVRIVLQAFQRGADYGVVAAFVPEDLGGAGSWAELERAHCVLRVWLRG